MVYIKVRVIVQSVGRTADCHTTAMRYAIRLREDGVEQQKKYMSPTRVKHT